MAVTHNSTNVVHNSLKLPQIIDSTYISTMKCFPRPPPLNAKDAPPPLERSEEPEGWTLPKSIFWGYYPDSEVQYIYIYIYFYVFFNLLVTA